MSDNEHLASRIREDYGLSPGRGNAPKSHPGDRILVDIKTDGMETPAREGRARKISLRLTEKEYLQLLSEMKSYDYLSVSRFIRDRLFCARMTLRREVVLTDRGIRDQINVLSSRVAKIGVDYNQATRRFNGLCKEQRSDGSPVINARAANYYLKQIDSMTRELKSTMDDVISLVSRIELERQPHGEAAVNNNQTQTP